MSNPLLTSNDPNSPNAYTFRREAAARVENALAPQIKWELFPHISADERDDLEEVVRPGGSHRIKTLRSSRTSMQSTRALPEQQSTHSSLASAAQRKQ